MASPVRKAKVKEVPLSEVKDDLSRFLREAETQDVVITRHGKPAGVLIGFKSEDDWFDYRLEHDRFTWATLEQAKDYGLPEDLLQCIETVLKREAHDA